MKKIICFSLWCQDKPMDNKNYQTHNMYCNGAIRNLEIQKNDGIYKDWVLRYYINNTVPKQVQDKIKELGGELVDMTDSKIPGMFWRFLAINDKSVDVFEVRDTDSRISKREEVAVNDFIESDKVLHVMRDHPHHYYKILGGMWGFKNNKADIDFSNMLDNFLKKRGYKFKRMDDMYFLDSVYDKMKDNILGHDHFFKFPENKDFPNYEFKNKYYEYVGEIFDENNNKPNLKRDQDLFKNYKRIMRRSPNFKMFR